MARERKPKRLLRLVQPPDGPAPGVISISTPKSSSYYVFREIPCAIGGRGFVVHRLGLGELYHVRIGSREECSCECLGFLRHGFCKHIAALMALVENQAI